MPKYFKWILIFYLFFCEFKLISQTIHKSWMSESFRKEMYSNNEYLSSYIEDNKLNSETLPQLQDRLINYCKRKISENIQSKIESITNLEKKEFNNNFDTKFNQQIKVTSKIELIKFENEYYFDEQMQKGFCFVFINKNNLKVTYEQFIISSIDYCQNQLELVSINDANKYLLNIKTLNELDSLMKICKTQNQLLFKVIDNYSNDYLQQKILNITNKINASSQFILENTKLSIEDCSYSPTFEKSMVNFIKCKLSYLSKPLIGYPVILNNDLNSIYYSKIDGKINIPLHLNSIEDFQKETTIKLIIQDNLNYNTPSVACLIKLKNTKIYLQKGNTEIENSIYNSLTKSLTDVGFIIENLNELTKYILRLEINFETSDEDTNGFFASFGTANLKVFTSKNELINNIQANTKGVGISKQQALLKLKTNLSNMLLEKVKSLLFNQN